MSDNTNFNEKTKKPKANKVTKKSDALKQNLLRRKGLKQGLQIMDKNDQTQNNN